MLKNRSIGIFTPFPFIIGGGERYIFTIAEAFSLRGDHVTILSPFPYNLKYVSKIFELKLENCTYKKTSAKTFFLPTLKKKYDYFFSLSNHITPPTFGLGKHNAIILQFPFPHPTTKLGDKIQKLLTIPKLLTFQKIVCYSEYSKKWVEKKLPKTVRKKIRILIIPPAIDVKKFSSQQEKMNIILSVGRFFVGDHSKNQLLLIESFKKLIKEKSMKDWELHLAGYVSKDKKNKKYFAEIKKNTKDYPIFLHPNISSEALIRLFKESKIFWHAAGFNNDETKTPEKSEHFGIVILEAMATGLVPIVANRGGVKEIIKNNRNGYLWDTVDDLLLNTNKVLHDNELLSKISLNAQTDVRKYDINNFRKILERYF